MVIIHAEYDCPVKGNFVNKFKKYRFYIFNGIVKIEMLKVYVCHHFKDR